ncbi:hypothetical protein GCM10010214_55430 [Streptomyces abikoensis]|nr:hypothetical protein GCM10010214_55430 [Streptomyces abikoensis]
MIGGAVQPVQGEGRGRGGRREQRGRQGGGEGEAAERHSGDSRGVCERGSGRPDRPAGPLTRTNAPERPALRAANAFAQDTCRPVP